MDYSSFQLKDKIAIVTGPAQGIGRAIALGLAQAGCNLVLAEHPDLHKEEIKSCKAEIEKLGRKAIIALTDISKVDQVRAMVDAAVKEFGRLDLLVNNAGWTCNGPALDCTEEDYDKTMDSTVKGTFFACQAAAKAMIPNGGGRIVNIGSNFAISAWSGRVVYCGAKADVQQLSRAMNLEWAQQGVVVNVVAPCITETPSRKFIIERPGYKDFVKEKIATGRWNQPEDLVGATLFLLSPMAAQVCGHILYVDGGWTIH